MEEFEDPQWSSPEIIALLTPGCQQSAVLHKTACLQIVGKIC